MNEINDYQKGDSQMPNQDLINIEKTLTESCYDCESQDVLKIIDMVVQNSNINDTFKAGICGFCYSEMLGGKEI